MKTNSSRIRTRWGRVALVGPALIGILISGCVPYPKGYKWNGQYFGLGSGTASQAENTYVKMIQNQLNAIRVHAYGSLANPTHPYPWAILKVDGIFGTGTDGNWATYNAVQEFQFLQGLRVTGAVGQTEWDHLFSDSWNLPGTFYRRGYSTCFGPEIFPNTGSGLPTSYPGIALHNYDSAHPKGQEGHLFLVAFYDDNWKLVSQQRLVQLDGMASTASTADITPSALQAAGFKCGDNPNVSLWQIN